jgi:hypothetical protein
MGFARAQRVLRACFRHARTCCGHPRLTLMAAPKTWMAGTSPAMTQRQTLFFGKLSVAKLTRIIWFEFRSHGQGAFALAQHTLANLAIGPIVSSALQSVPR